MRRIKLFGVASGLAVVAALALSGFVASSSANLVLTCYKVSKFEKEKRAGNFKDPECKEEVKKLTGEYVLAEPLAKTVEYLWCAEITQTPVLESETGNFENNKCEGAKKDSDFIEVNVEPTKVLPLPSTTSPLSLKGKGGKGVLLTVGKEGKEGSEVKCEKTAGTGSFTSANLGEFTTTFEGCKAKVPIIGTAPCTGEGDEKEKILLKGEVHYWLALLSGKLVAALVFLFKELHFTCEALGQKQLILVKGCAAALAEPVETLTKTTKDVFKEEKSGVSDIREVLPQETTKEIKCITETNVNAGGFIESAQTGTIENEEFKQGGKAVEVLLMNKEM